MNIAKINKQAFSLIELSIAVIIISIISAVTFVANDLRKSAAIRIVAVEVEEINIALTNFYETTNGVAGDFNRAAQFWQSDCAAKSIECNGNGNNIIEAYSESHLAWYHLYLGNFYVGNFSGTGDGDDKTQTANINVAEAAIKHAQYAIIHYHWPEFPDEHIILLAGKTIGDIGKNAIIDPNTAFSLDEKIDDGKPASGNVYGRNGYNDDWYSSNCIIDNNGNRVANSENKDPTWEYNMNISGHECILGFKFNSDIAYDPPR